MGRGGVGAGKRKEGDTVTGPELVGFIKQYIPYNELGQRWQLQEYQEVVLSLMWAKKHSIRCWSEPKKSGKSHVTECGLIADAMTDPGVKLGIFANDSEQAESIIYTGCCDLIEKNPDLSASAKILAKKIRFSNGSEIEWFASDYEGGAGHRRKGNAIDEPWAFSSERMTRLYEELLPIPTMPDSYLWLSTTAGFTGEGALLEDLYKRGLAGKRISRKYEVYEDKGLCMFWSHKPRQPWQTKKYYDEQRRLLRPNTFARQHGNEWVSAESAFITAQQWDAVVDDALSPLLPTKEYSLTLGVDIGTKNDNGAVVGARRDESGKVVVCFHRVWRPKFLQPVQLADIEEFIRETCRSYRVHAIAFDPSQAYSMIQGLQRSGLPAVEFPQTTANTTAMATELFNLVTGKNLRSYPDKTLREHIINAVGVETGSGVRMAKSTASRKIDIAAALAIACVTLLRGPMPLDLTLLYSGGSRIAVMGW